ncbi:MAG TPA: transcription termination/antitermination protein NusG [Longimicrobium sp.]|jgi:transcriptional antiterminator NusG|nr:transcription termination/antitermination protein NusG [Longimicrobium sp.]
MADAKWYAIQSYSGHENKVQRLIQRRIDEEQGEPETRQIQEVMVPTREEVELRNGKRVTVTRKLYPGYVLVKMVYNQRTAHLVNSIQGVIKFLGTGAEPAPLTDDELSKVLGQEVEAPAAAEAPVVLIPFNHGQVVEVTDGPFKEFSGTVQDIDHDKGKVKVEVSLFGRPTSIELDYTQLRGF